MVIKATSLRDVSLIAMVPESEWRMPTLIDPVSAAGAIGAGAAGAAGAVAGFASSGLLQLADASDRAIAVSRNDDRIGFLPFIDSSLFLHLQADLNGIGRGRTVAQIA
jgi:hypothetical protein